MSNFHSLKSSADTRLMPGGRCSWICGTGESEDQTLLRRGNLAVGVDVGAYFGKLLSKGSAGTSPVRARRTVGSWLTFPNRLLANILAIPSAAGGKDARTLKLYLGQQRRRL